MPLKAGLDEAAIQGLGFITELVENELPDTEGRRIFLPQLQRVLGAVSDGYLSLLPVLTCEAAGGDRKEAVPVWAAWQLSRVSAKILDDAADGQLAHAGAGASSLAPALLFLAPLALRRLTLRTQDPDAFDDLVHSWNRSGLQAATGQGVGGSARTAIEPDQWFAIAKAKSGEPLAWAAWAGALVAGADVSALSSFREYGLCMGLLLQVADDFNDVWSAHGDSDLRSGQTNLAVAYGRFVANEPQRTLLESLLSRSGGGDLEAQLQAEHLLIRMGAQAYLLMVAEEQRRMAMAVLQQNGHAAPSLVALADHVWPALAAFNPRNTPFADHT